MTVDLIEGGNVIKTWQEIKSEVGTIDSFPDEAEDPVISIESHRRNVLTAVLHGPADELTLRSAADAIRDKLLLYDGINQVELTGVKDCEVKVEIPKDTLRRYGLTLADVATAISNASVEMGGGSLKTEIGDILVRVKDRREYATQYAGVPLLTRENGSRIVLGDVATVREGFEDTNTWARFDGESSVMIVIYRVGDQTPTEVANAGKTAITEIIRTLPQNVHLSILNDRSERFRQRAKLLTKNSFQGLTLVFIFLALFLETRLAFWVSLGIPVSFAGSFIFLSATNFTINMISMFAFIATLGIVVDDAVVVGENIYHWRLKGLDPLMAAIEGVREVGFPVLFSVLTNMVSFLPILFVPGHLGKVFKVMPLVVTAVFTVSLIERLFILPSHLSHRTQAKAPWPLNYLETWQERFSQAFEFFVRNRFGKFLRVMVNYRHGVIAFGIALMMALAEYVASGLMGLEMFPRSESDYAYCAATLPYGSSDSRLKRVENQLIRSARSVIEKNGDTDLSKGILSNVSDNLIQVRVYLTDKGKRPLSTSQVTELWRKETPSITGLENIRFESNMGGPGSGKNLTVRLSHTDGKILEKAGEGLAAALSVYTIVHGINDGSAQGKRQFDIQLLPLGERMGLTSEDIARQVRYAFQGAEALKQQRGRNEITVRVALPRNERANEHTLEDLVIRSDAGEVYLKEAAKMHPGRAYTEIERINGRRTIEVTANVTPQAKAENILNEIKTKIYPDLEKKYPGLAMGLGGNQEEMRKSLAYLVTGSLMALFAIYALLAIPFKSYSQPLIIMVSITFGISGAVIGHIIMGYFMSANSIFGMVALSGVMVNGSLVLIDFSNRMVLKGATPREAILAASVQRFRPILLTTITTFGGLMAMITKTSKQARMMIPMAISLGFGVLFSTAIILVLVPALYVMLDDISQYLNKRKKKEKQSGIVIEPLKV